MRSRFKSAVEHNTMLRKLVPLARSTGAVHLLHMCDDLVNRGKWTTEDEERVASFFQKHDEQFRMLNDLLEDDFSKRTLRQVMEYRRTRKLSALNGVVVLPQYFQKDIFLPVDDEVFVDGGAYNGDTVESFMTNFIGGVITKGYLPGNRMGKTGAQ